jgi:transcriptional regulator GlxA family with amidase domain
MTRRVCFVLFPGFQLLDVAGPIAAFEIASGFVAGAYQLELCARLPGPVRSSSGISLEAKRFARGSGLDTLMVAGGDGMQVAIEDAELLRFLRRAAAQVRRTTSVCSGSLLLAAAGLLDGRRATTHWCRALEMKQRFPRVCVEADRIWVRDGAFWTSAGITAGIDLALALVADDLGSTVSRRVARQLVVYAQRPGGQTQHSRLLDLTGDGNRFAELNVWIRERLELPLGVAVLAARMKMSPRTFARAYTAETGVTPAKAVERLRVEAAQTLISTGQQSMQEVAERTGFGSMERMRRSFVRIFGTPPSSQRPRGAEPQAHRQNRPPIRRA